MDVLGIDPVPAAVLPAEPPNIAGVTPKGLAAFAGLSPRKHYSGTSVHPPGRISRIGSERLRRPLFMAALSSRRRDPALTGFVARPTGAGKPPKVILIAIARKCSCSPTP